MSDNPSEPRFTPVPPALTADLPKLDETPAAPPPVVDAYADAGTDDVERHDVEKNDVETLTFQFNGSAMRTLAVAVVFLVIGFLGGAALISGRGANEAEIEAMVRAIVAEEIAAVGVGGPITASSLADDDPSFGPSDAPVTIVEFSDFYCGYCTRFATQTLPQLRERYGEHIHFVYRDLPIIGGQISVDAAVAGNCAHDQDGFWGFHDLLFANNGARTRDAYLGFAGELGLDADAFATCLDDQTKIDEVMLDYVDGQTLGVTGTPKFYINGKVISGAQPFETFVLVIDAELNRAGITPPVGEDTPEA